MASTAFRCTPQATLGAFGIAIGPAPIGHKEWPVTPDTLIVDAL